MVLGSEGRLGIISEATVHVHRLPDAARDPRLPLPRLAARPGRDARDRRQRGVAVGHARVRRERDAVLLRHPEGPVADRSGQVQGPDDVPASAGATSTSRPCACRSSATRAPRTTSPRSASSSAQIVERHGGLCIGASPGELYDQKKFDTPYIRDYLLDRGALADVSETAAPWSALPTVYGNVMAVRRRRFDDLRVHGYIMCHLSHSYHSGACLYFTFGFKPSGAREPLEEYDVVKSAIQQTFVDSGATLSHHHAVGTEHAPWLEQDISAPGVAMLRALFDGMDPGANLNPGKIVSSSRSRV